MTLEQQPAAATRYRWVIFGMACGTSWLLYLHRYVFGLIKPTLADEYGLGETELGLLDSGFGAFYSGFQVPLGIAVDAGGVRLVLTGMIVLWCVGLALHAWATTKHDLWYGRAIMGAGQSAVYAALSRITRNWFPARVRTSVQGWVGVFFGRIGGVSSNLLVGSLMLGVLLLPWRTAVNGLAVFGIVYAIAFAILYRNSPREHWAVNAAEVELIEGSAAGEVEPAPPRMTVRQMFAKMSPRSIANLLALNIQTILSALADNIYSAWIPLFLASVHGLKFKEMGVYSALPLLGGACGGAFGGWLNDWIIRVTGRRRWARTGVGFAGKGLAAVLLMVAMLWYDDPYGFCTILFFVKFFSDWSLTTTWGTVTDIGGRSTATVFAFNNSVATIGAIVAPTIYGTIAEHASWKYVFLTGAGAYLLCALSWFAIDCRIPVISEDSQDEQQAGD